jgi:hypothetical protein
MKNCLILFGTKAKLSLTNKRQSNVWKKELLISKNSSNLTPKTAQKLLIQIKKDPMRFQRKKGEPNLVILDIFARFLQMDEQVTSIGMILNMGFLSLHLRGYKVLLLEDLLVLCCAEHKIYGFCHPRWSRANK